MLNFFYPNFFCRGHTTNHDTRGQKVVFYHFSNIRLPSKLFELTQLCKDEQGNRAGSLYRIRQPSNHLNHNNYTPVFVSYL